MDAVHQNSTFEMCIICMENYSNSVEMATEVTPCGHQFHAQCLQNAFTSQQGTNNDNICCPFCKSVVCENPRGDPTVIPSKILVLLRICRRMFGFVRYFAEDSASAASNDGTDANDIIDVNIDTGNFCRTVANTVMETLIENIDWTVVQMHEDSCYTVRSFACSRLANNISEKIVDFSTSCMDIDTQSDESQGTTPTELSAVQMGSELPRIQINGVPEFYRCFRQVLICIFDRIVKRIAEQTVASIPEREFLNHTNMNTLPIVRNVVGFIQTSMGTQQATRYFRHIVGPMGARIQARGAVTTGSGGN